MNLFTHDSSSFEISSMNLGPIEAGRFARVGENLRARSRETCDENTGFSRFPFPAKNYTRPTLCVFYRFESVRNGTQKGNTLSEELHKDGLKTEKIFSPRFCDLSLTINLQKVHLDLSQRYRMYYMYIVWLLNLKTIGGRRENRNL